MELQQIRTQIFNLASDAITEWFHPDNHTPGQKYILQLGDDFCKLMIYRNCFEPCMSYGVYFEDYHILYSNVVDGKFIQSSFYIERDDLGNLVLPQKKFKVDIVKSRKNRRNTSI